MAKKKKTTASASQTTQTTSKAQYAPMKRSTISVFTIILAVMIAVFAWKWLEAIRDGYFDAFVLRGDNVEAAVEGMTGLTLTEEEEAALLTLQQDWDAYTSSRLSDEVTITATDGTELHARYYDEGSAITVVVVQRFDLDSTDDFLPGAWLYESYGCNILLIDQRLHGQSGGSYFGFGYLEQYDLPCWLEWAQENLHTEQFILWGEGTGANTILFAAASGLLPESVTCIVAESPYASLHELAKRNIWKFYAVTAFPFLNAIEYKLAHSDAGYTIDDLDLVAALSAEADYPATIFLISEEDEYILPEWTESVYEAYAGEKTLLTGGGSHGTVYALCTEEVQSLVAAWIG